MQDNQLRKKKRKKKCQLIMPKVNVSPSVFLRHDALDLPGELVKDVNDWIPPQPVLQAEGWESITPDDSYTIIGKPFMSIFQIIIIKN